ncbi:MAG: hypothetical protein M9916_10555 [Crocinitomicaceae bacterium]|nr:hypothetical protein [Crocinitomicaceae bacterium]
MNDFVLYFILVQVILLIPSFYFYSWIFSKTKLVAVKAYSFLCTILFPIIFTCVFVNINNQYISPWLHSEKFDSKKWQNNDKYRYRMKNDILKNNVLIGKTKNEVIALLGNDIEHGPCKDCIGYSTYEPVEGFSIDHEVLEIYFDDQNRVTSVSINYW